MEFLQSIGYEFSQLLTMPVNCTPGRLLASLTLALILSFVLGMAYMKTFKGSFYLSSYVQTLVILTAVCSLIIVIVGTNVAQAFTLAGALSLVRFRTTMRDPRDVAFIFMAMAVGLACGAAYYLAAIAFTIIITIVLVLMHVFKYGHRENIKKLLRVSLPDNLNQVGLFDDIFKKYMQEVSLRSVKCNNLGTLYELEYSIIMKDGFTEQQLIDEVRTRNGNLNVAVLLEEQPIIF